MYPCEIKEIIGIIWKLKEEMFHMRMKLLNKKQIIRRKYVCMVYIRFLKVIK